MTRAVPVGQSVVLVACGGAAGSLARWAVTAAVPDGPGPRLAATLGVNAAGCLLMGLLLVAAVEHRHERLRLLLGTGLLGGFTTYSGFVADVQALVGDAQPALAAGYLLATVALCLLAVLAGRGLGHALVARGRA